jgi:alpha-methylacyl-CoA racemase
MGGPPGAFAAMLLADHGADVIKISRLDGGGSVGASRPISKTNAHDRGKREVPLDLASTGGTESLLRLVTRANVLIEGFRPGVVERLGVGPHDCMSRNPALVYGRITGWGQTGPWSRRAGHDINYLALSGVLHAIGAKDGPPIVPVNLVGDFAGGMLLAFGLVSALIEVQSSGVGQVVDAAMLDAAALLASNLHAGVELGTWIDERASNIVDGGHPYYGVYETSDHKYVAIGSLEPQFFASLVEHLGLDPSWVLAQHDSTRWPALRSALQQVFLTKTQSEWSEIMRDHDVCFAPVLSIRESHGHPHNVKRSTFIRHEGVVQPAPGPRFSDHPVAIRPWAECAVPIDQTLEDWGFSPTEIADIRSLAAIPG